MYKAYFDRLTDTNEALLVVEQLKKEYHVPSSSLPEGSVVGTWFLVEIEDETITSLQIDKDETEMMQRRIENRRQRLKSNQKSRFKRN